MRTYNPDIVTAATEQCRDDLKGLPPTTWLENVNNIALCNDKGDVSLFEKRQEGVYCGHYFFLSRGKDAVDSALEMLAELFNDYDVNVIIGMTPLDKRGALWLSRRLGFNPHNDEDINGRMHRIFTMTRKDWNEQPSRR